MVFHECKICNYSTQFISNYKVHLTTNKHIKNMNKNNSFVEETKINCPNCTKVFNNLSNYKKHYSICKISNNQTYNRIMVDDTKIKDYDNKNQGVVIPKQSLSVKKNTLAPKESQLALYKQKQISCKEKQLNKNLSLNDNINSKNDNINNSQTKIKNHVVANKNDKKTFVCQYCFISCSKKSNLTRHYKTCCHKDHIINLKNNQNAEMLEIAKLKQIIEEKEKEILIKENEKLKVVIEKDQELLKEKDKAIEIAKKSNTSITNIQNNNKTINFLNNQYGDMIAMEKFLYNLENHEQLTDIERKNLLTSYKENGIDVFARNFSYIMKQNCRRQLEKEGINDMKLLPLFCSDGSLRSHKEKGKHGWKPHYDNQSINQMLNISNDQVYETYHQLIPITGKDRNRVYNIVKRDNHIEKIKCLENKE